MNTPNTIKIFLPQGDPTGIKIIELVGRDGKGFIIPRNNLIEALKREELKSPAVYFLIGKNEDGEDIVYIGESDNFTERISYHQRKKDFWNIVICFISTNGFLHRGNVKYLEAVLSEELKNAGRVKIESGKKSNKSPLSESEEADTLSYAENLKMVMSAVGFTFLEEVTNEQNKKVLYYCKGKGVVAIGVPTTEGFVILKGSTISGKEAKTIPKGINNERIKVFQSSKISKLGNDDYKLLDDIIFSTSSYAAGFVLGNSVDGLKVWRNKHGKMLGDVE